MAHIQPHSPVDPARLPTDEDESADQPHHAIERTRDAVTCEFGRGQHRKSSYSSDAAPRIRYLSLNRSARPPLPAARCRCPQVRRGCYWLGNSCAREPGEE
jgi:hypothetical protein